MCDRTLQGRRTGEGEGSAEARRETPALRSDGSRQRYLWAEARRVHCRMLSRFGSGTVTDSGKVTAGMEQDGRVDGAEDGRQRRSPRGKQTRENGPLIDRGWIPFARGIKRGGGGEVEVAFGRSVGG